MVNEKVVKTLTIDKAQAEALATRAKSKIDKAYYMGYAIAMGHAMAVIERGLGPALVTDDVVRSDIEYKIKEK